MKSSAALWLFPLLAMLAGCSEGTGEQPRESREEPAAESSEPQNQELLNTMNPALERARGVEQSMQEAEEKRRRQMEDQMQQ